MDIRDRMFACFISGAIGDALGYPIEFMRLSEIKSKYGTNGITNLMLMPDPGKP